MPQLPDNALTSDLIVLGFVVSITVNIFVNLVLILLFLLRRLRKTGIPAWLMIVNFLFFAAQLTIFILNRNLR